MMPIYKPSTEEYLLFNSDVIQNPELLNNTMQSMALDQNTCRLRGQAIFFDYAGSSLVLKNYFRGGLMARFSHDKYLWSGLRQTRAYKEFYLLEAMNVLNLPVPTPIAAKIKRHTLFYSAELVTKRIDNAIAFGEVLKTNSVSKSSWFAIGELIHLFHRHGVYHSDLNANNILITDSNQLYFIDFDKSYFRMKTERWMKNMLNRLKRSLTKFKINNPGYHFTDKDWSILLEGYRVSKNQ